MSNIGSCIKSEEGSVKMSGRNVNLQNTDIDGQREVMVNAEEDINVTTALNREYKHSSKSKSNIFTGREVRGNMSSSASI